MGVVLRTGRGASFLYGVEEQEVVSPDRHLVVGMTELDKGEYGDVSFAVIITGSVRCHWSVWEWKRTGRNMPAT